MNSSQPMKVTPFFYLTYENGGLETIKINEANAPPKVDGLKVIRRREQNYFEQFEFASLPDMQTFVVHTRNSINYNLWDMMHYFSDNLQSLLFDAQINEYDPRFIMARFDETTSQRSYIVSYNKIQYASVDDARKDTQLFNGDPQGVIK